MPRLKAANDFPLDMETRASAVICELAREYLPNGYNEIIDYSALV
jgi:hypothetical protein